MSLIYGAIIFAGMLLAAALFWGLFLREAGLIDRTPDYDGPIEGWHGQPMREDE